MTMKYMLIMLRRYAVPLAVFTVSRIGLFVVVYASMVLLPSRPGDDLWSAFSGNMFLDGWFRWDSGWYMEIIAHGYTNQNKGIGQDTAFFPMYPLVGSLVNLVIGNAFISGMIVSNVAFLLALVVLYDLLVGRFGEEVAMKSIVLLAVNPFAFYFSSVYTESIFLLFIVLSFFSGERGDFKAAALWGALASATRLVGVVMIVSLFILYLERKEFNIKRVEKDVLYILAVILGPLAYMAYLQVVYGDPMQFVISQKVWGALSPYRSIYEIFSNLSLRDVLGGAYDLMGVINLLSVFPLILLVFWGRKIGYSYVIYSLLVFIVSLSRFQGLGRYMVVAFPGYIVLGVLMRGWGWFWSYAYVNVLFLSLLAILFSHWYWVA